jgi:UDP-2-acetamido-3-amino-2,3-dideoxy-glucuronate N-acetyltransferase
MIDAAAFIHPKAHVDEGCTVGARTKVWQFASVTRGTVLGEDCSVSPHAMLDGSKYGDRVVISGGVMAGDGFEVGDDVFLGPNVTLCNDRWPSASKNGYRGDLLRRGFVTVRIKSGAWVGANAVLLPGVTVGKMAAVAAGSAVHCDVPDGYLFTRSNGMFLIKDSWRERRMIEAREPQERRQFAS